MKIVVKQAAPDVFSLTFEDTEIPLEGRDLKNLLLQVTKVLAPGGATVKNPEDKAKEFVRHIKTANDIGIQKFLMTADQGDILVFLKVTEDDQAIKDKLYGNMSDRLGKILAEDIAYKFKDGVSTGQASASTGRLMALAEDLEKSGTLVYESVVKRS
jgi:hypothetical protein